MTFQISPKADEDLEKHLAYIVRRDGIDRASYIYDQIIGKIELISKSPFELGAKLNGFPQGVKRVFFKGVFIYYKHDVDELLVIRIISRFRNQGTAFDS